MNKQVARMLIIVSIFVLGYFALSLVSIISQLALLVEHSIPGFGQVFFWGLLVVFAGLLIAPAVIYYQLPKPLTPPKESTPQALAAYSAALRVHLAENPRLAGVLLETDEQVRNALALLSAEATKIVQDSASAVFVSTAVMQNGRLDALFVLAAQVRMLWKIAKVFYQRPSPRQILYLYSNVGTNVLIADNVQEIDFSELTTPIVVSILPSLKGGIPGLQGISTLLVNSMANGAANAFLTLRTGLLARAYCEALSEPLRPILRQSVTLAALTLVGEIVKEQGAAVAKRSWTIVSDAVEGTTEAVVDSAKKATSVAMGKMGATVTAVKDTALDVGKVVADTTEQGLAFTKDRVTDGADFLREMPGRIFSAIKSDRKQ